MSGQLWVVSAPSGAGKTSLVKALLEKDDGLTVCVSHTTRPPRAHEVNGLHYHFIDLNTFEEMVNQQAFVEHACVFSHGYGTSVDALESALSTGRDVLLEIDCQGALQIQRRFQHAKLIFVLPPSLEALQERLRGRQSDSPSVIAERLAGAREEISHWNHFDFVIVNKEFDLALSQLSGLIKSQRLHREHLPAPVRTLINNLL